MRYRVKEYVINLLRVDNIIQVGIAVPPAIFESLTIDVNNDHLDNASKKFVTESVRLITDETRGGYVLMSTGQKGVIESIYKIGTQGLVLNISIPALIAAADGDEDDLAAIAAMANSDQFTIEFDWGDVPSGLSGGTYDQMLAQFFGLTEATEYTPLTQAEVIASTRAEQVNAWGEDGCPIPNYLPAGVTEAMVEAAATALGITYYEPNFNIATL